MISILQSVLLRRVSNRLPVLQYDGSLLYGRMGQQNNQHDARRRTDLRIVFERRERTEEESVVVVESIVLRSR